MGGDGGAETVLDGTRLAAADNPDAHFIVFGDEPMIRKLIGSDDVASRISVMHTDEVVSAEDRPSQAIRRGRNSSMGLAIQAVKEGKAQVAVSAGNTGALMALSKFLLQTMKGIERPALAALVPTIQGDSLMLDLGANVECDEDNLIQFAIMGAAFARTVLGISHPRVGLLNVGVEELKGNETVKSAGARLRKTPLPMEFAGYTEGDRMYSGDVHVIVTDGFTGNVAIKTAEGTARLIRNLLSAAFRASILAKLGYRLARGGLDRLSEHLDPNNHNGGIFMGLNGLVVKSHGGANASGFATAIDMAVKMARADLTRRIAQDLKNFSGSENSDEALQEAAG